MCSTLSTINVTLTYPFILITFIRLIGIYSNEQNILVALMKIVIPSYNENMNSLNFD